MYNRNFGHIILNINIIIVPMQIHLYNIILLLCLHILLVE